MNMKEMESPSLVFLYYLRRRKLKRRSIVNIAMDMVMEEKRLKVGYGIMVVLIIILMSLDAFLLFVG